MPKYAAKSPQNAARKSYQIRISSNQMFTDLNVQASKTSHIANNYSNNCHCFETRQHYVVHGDCASQRQEKGGSGHAGKQRKYGISIEFSIYSSSLWSISTFEGARARREKCVLLSYYLHFSKSQNRHTESKTQTHTCMSEQLLSTEPTTHLLCPI